MAIQELKFSASNSTPREYPARKVRIEYKERWEDEEWTPLPHFRVESVSWNCSPSMGKAQFSARYGYGMQPGETEPGWHPAVGLDSKFVHIVVGDELEEEWQWWGVVKIEHGNHEDEVHIDPAEPLDYWPMGERKYLAYGLELFLDDHLIRSSTWKGLGEVKLAEVGLEFNKGGKPNRSTDKYLGSYYYFADETWEPEYWSTRDIVEYLLKSPHGLPMDNTGTQRLPFIIAEAELNKLPTWDQPVVETHLMSMRQILDSLINRRRLYTWWIDVSVGQNANIKIATFTSVNLLMGALGTIPANTNAIKISYDDDAENPTATPKSLTLTIDESHQVDQVVAYGAKRRNICTLGFGELFELDSGWDAALLTEYESAGMSDPAYPAAGEKKDQQRFIRDARNAEKFKSVFSRFKLLSPLDGFNYPIDDPDGYAMFFDNVTIEPTMPLQEGQQADGEAIDSGNIVSVGEGPFPERPPMLIIESPVEPGAYVKSGEIGIAEDQEVDDEDAVRSWSASVRVPRDGKNLVVKTSGAPAHVLGYGEFTPNSLDEDVYGHWDWTTMKATVAITDERYAEGVYPADDALPDDTSAKQVLRIPVGEQYQLHFVAQDTIVDLAGDGTPLVVGTAGYLRDDREQLVQLANMAYQWYGKPRKVVRLRGSYDSPCEDIELGQILFAVSSGKIQSTGVVNSLITEIQLSLVHDQGPGPRNNLPPMRFQIQTSSGELDLVRMGGTRGRNKG